MEKKAVWRKDYKPVDFATDKIELIFDVGDKDVSVTARYPLKPLKPGAELRLDGSSKLESIAIDGRKLGTDEYRIEGEQLIVAQTPGREFAVEVKSKVDPFANKSLMGLYETNGSLLTQCEAEGFRKIAYFFDRPDVLTKFDVEIYADKDKYPILLSNGNPMGSGEVERGGKTVRFARWSDPFPKPTYLFCLVAGDLAETCDSYVTQSGRKVGIRFYCDKADAPQIKHAVNSLKKAMKWDETRWGLEYDLDLYMVVAAADYNMGAMENKGLNVFNTKYVLADPSFSTDADYENIEDVITHEYCHNWTGDRVTLRDWFQLSLKEGLTVFRDQEYTSDAFSRPIKRIGDVAVMRRVQFAEDSGPTRHPVRPEKYEEINNFYTATVYEKGAEVVRMYHTLFGEGGFRDSLRAYLKKHDGSAATCDDFRRSFERTCDFDLSQFELWYSQAGTPAVTASARIVAGKPGQVEIKLGQQLPPNWDGSESKPMLIPFRMALLDKETGAPLSFKVIAKNGRGPKDAGHGWMIPTSGEDGRSRAIPNGEGATQEAALLLTSFADSFVLEGVGRPFVLSALRGFSAPVNLEVDRDAGDLEVLARSDSDAFARWDALQTLYRREIKRLVEAGASGAVAEADASVARGAVEAAKLVASQDPAFAALLLTPPQAQELLTLWRPADPIAIFEAREALLDAMAQSEPELWNKLREDMARRERQAEEAFAKRKRADPKASGETFDYATAAPRYLQNAARSMLACISLDAGQAVWDNYDKWAGNMTHELGLMRAINREDGPMRRKLLDKFASRHAQSPLAMDKYFNLVATCPAPGAAARVREAARRPDFNLRNPNRVYSLYAAFCSNLPGFHAKDGSGYDLVAEAAIAIDKFNPQVAARLVSGFSSVSLVDAESKGRMAPRLRRIASEPGLSPDVAEKVKAMLKIVGA